MDPGEYIMECYVKDATNDVHSYLGMIEHLSVTGDESEVGRPVSLSGPAPGSLPAGSPPCGR